MKIVVAGETYAENLGDGVIALSLAHLLRQLGLQKPSELLEITHLDLSARQDWPKPAVSQAPAGVKPSGLLARVLPPTLKRLLRWHLKGDQSARRGFYRAHLAGADLLLIGGGQLLMDNQLLFPLAIDLLTQLAAEQRVPCQIVCCGMGKRWSTYAQRLLQRSLKRVQGISLRDAGSLKNLAALCPGRVASVVADPALWASEAFEIVPAPVSSRKTLGIGIIGASSLNAHLRDSCGLLTDESLLARWLELLAVLRTDYAEIELFTNGHPEDFELAQLVQQQARQRLGLECRLAARPQQPRELVQMIAGYRLLLAYRLHSCIIGASLGVPVVGIEWDSKVRAFFQELGRESLCLGFLNASPQAIRMALSAAEARPEEGSLQRKKQQLLTALAAQLGGSLRHEVPLASGDA